MKKEEPKKVTGFDFWHELLWPSNPDEIHITYNPDGTIAYKISEFENQLYHSLVSSGPYKTLKQQKKELKSIIKLEIEKDKNMKLGLPTGGRGSST